MSNKTIFITITRGILARNILRTGVLEKLLAQNLKVVLLLPGAISDYFKKEFSHPNIIFERLPDKRYGKFRKFIIILFNGLVYTETEHRMLRFGGGEKGPKSWLVFWVSHVTFSLISRLKFLKLLARWLENRVFVERDYDYLFKKYQPALLFCSSIYAKMDTILIKAAKRFGVPTLSMPKSWDTVGRLFFRVLSDKIILSNEFMKDWVEKSQLVEPENILISGMPQFDIYKNKTSYFSKEEFCRLTNLDSNKPIVLFVSEGAWTHWDEIYIEDLIKNYGILEKYNLILRPHYSNLKRRIYHRFKKYQRVYVDDEHLRITDMFSDSWDATASDMDWLAEVLNSSDLVIAFASTMVLEAQIFDKPVANIYYDLPYHLPTIPMKELFNCVHYNAVLAEKSVILAKSAAELMTWLEKFCQDLSLMQAARQRTVNKLCYRVDGQGSARIAEFIIKYLK